MCLNHLILPLQQPAASKDIYRWLMQRRRVLITALIWAGFAFHYLPSDKISIQLMGTVAFAAGLQFLPGIVAILYWPQANKRGFFVGLASGVGIWFPLLMLPLLSETYSFSDIVINWRETAALSLIINCLAFIFG